jgi:predicted TIM-barrel fold metal-dependent hydrolase
VPQDSRIDIHCHFLPDGYRAVLARHGLDNIAGAQVPDWSPELQEAFMRAWGIGTSVLSLSDPGVYFGDAGEARETARLVNEAGAELVAGDQARWGALATLPLPDVEAAIAELEHALDVLKLDGVGLLSNIDGVYLGDPSLADLYAELDRRGSLVFVHPAVPVERPNLVYPPFLFEFTFDTTRAFVNLMYLGVSRTTRASAGSSRTPGARFPIWVSGCHLELSTSWSPATSPTGRRLTMPAPTPTPR